MAEPDMAREHALAEGSTFTWHELYVPDGEAGIRFYAEVLGCRVEDLRRVELR